MSAAGDARQPVAASLDELLAGVATGDRDAFARLYDATVPRIFGLVRRLIVDPSLAEEVTQDVYLEIWQSATRYEPSRGSATTWMFTLAHRRAVDRIRAVQASRDRDAKVGARDLDVDYDSVAEVVELRLESARVERALAQLTELQREAVVLAYFTGLSHSEVASALHVPLGTVKTRLRDGLIRLRDHLGVTS